MKTLNILLFITLSSCITGKIETKTGVQSISFGSGGGFTGAVNTYTLTSNSTLIKDEAKPIKIEPKTTLDIFHEAKKLGKYTFRESGNMYSFLEIKIKDEVNKIVWPYGSTKVDQRVISLYNKLSELK